MRPTISALRAATIAAAATLTVFTGPAVASADGLAGSWRGNGSVVLPSGATEKARCRASFSKNGGKTYSMNAVCASSSARVAQTASLEQVGANRFTGDFTNSDYGVTGTIHLTLSGNSLSANLTGGGARAFFNLNR
ncbi:MAG: hypothetical protein ABL901_06720 [Hyphomicrobiaceae bacterium]